MFRISRHDHICRPSQPVSFGIPGDHDQSCSICGTPILGSHVNLRVHSFQIFEQEQPSCVPSRSTCHHQRPVITYESSTLETISNTAVRRLTCPTIIARHLQRAVVSSTRVCRNVAERRQNGPAERRASARVAAPRSASSRPAPRLTNYLQFRPSQSPLSMTGLLHVANSRRGRQSKGRDKHPIIHAPHMSA